MENKSKKIEIILKKKLLKICESNELFKSDKSLSGDHYFNTYSSSIGNKKLKKFFYGISTIYFVLKNVFTFFFLREYDIYTKKIISRDILVSFASIDNFLNIKEFFWGKGIFSKHIEEYFPIKKKNLNKVLIYKDKNLIKKTEKNISFFFQGNQNRLLNKYLFLKYIIENNSIKNIFCFINSDSYLAYYFFQLFKKRINLTKLENIFIAYEGQPFQKYFINNIKKYNSKCKILAYDHALDAFPINLLYDSNFSPDLLMVHSRDQYQAYIKYLNWPKERLKLIKSLRFSRQRSKRLENSLILPYDIDKKKIEKYTSIYENFLLNLNFKIKPFQILIHPQKKNDYLHINFLKKLDLINKKNLKKFSNLKSKKISIIFGNSSSVVELLEFTKEVFHIVIDREIEIYSDLFWPNIKKNFINQNVIKYEIFKQNHSLVWK